MSREIGHRADDDAGKGNLNEVKLLSVRGPRGERSPRVLEHVVDASIASKVPWFAMGGGQSVTHAIKLLRVHGGCLGVERR